MIGEPGQLVGLGPQVSCAFVSHDKLYPEEGAVHRLHGLISVQSGESLHVKCVQRFIQDFFYGLLKRFPIQVRNIEKLGNAFGPLSWRGCRPDQTQGAVLQLGHCD